MKFPSTSPLLKNLRSQRLPQSHHQSLKSCMQRSLKSCLQRRSCAQRSLKSCVERSLTTYVQGNLQSYVQRSLQSCVQRSSQSYVQRRLRNFARKLRSCGSTLLSSASQKRKCARRAQTHLRRAPRKLRLRAPGKLGIVLTVLAGLRKEQSRVGRRAEADLERQRGHHQCHQELPAPEALQLH